MASAGLTGLARGIMAGTQLGMSINEQKARRSREAEESLLRMEASERADRQDARAQESHEATLAQMKSQEERAVKQEKRLGEAHELNKIKVDLDIKKQNWDIARQVRQEKETQLKSMAPVEFQRVLDGGQFSDEFMEASKGTKFDPRFMASPEYKEASKIAYDTANTVVKKFMQDPDSVNVSDYNNPEFIDSMNVILGPDINYGVGEKDARTGKTVSNKRIVSVLPYFADNLGGYVFEVETTLDDGTKYTAPITENRTSDPDDPIRVIPFESLLDNINGSMQMASAFNQSDLKNYMTANFPVGGKDTNVSSKEVTRRQWLREQGDVDKWETDQINKIDPLTVDDPEAAAEKIRVQAQERRDRINDRYGHVEPVSVGAKGSEIKTPSGGGETRMDINTWAEGSSSKQRFIQESQAYADERGVENPFNKFSPAELDEIYREWQNEQEASEVAGLMR